MFLLHRAGQLCPVTVVYQKLFARCHFPFDTLVCRKRVAFQHGSDACRNFAQTVAEALLLCRKLCDYNIGRLLQQPAAVLAKTCEKFRLASLLTSQGAALATDVLVDLLKKHAPSGRLPVSLSDEMLHGCPTYFPYRQQVYLQASYDT